MIQEIAPKHLDNQYRPEIPQDTSKICIFRGKEILIARDRNNEVILPDYATVRDGIGETIYLFSVDDTAFFLAKLNADVPEGYGYEVVRELRKQEPMYMIYAIMTAWHLNVWYSDNRFCGRCGTPTVHHGQMRMLSCPNCANQIFPKICPAVIVGVTNGDRILLTRYAGRAYKSYALVAGFIEIGETAEEAVAREVLEETGVHVKNVRYWATQPWGIDTDLLLGYFAELDGSEEITVDRGELSMAGWYRADEIDIVPDKVSLTQDMMRAFMEGRHMQPRG